MGGSSLNSLSNRKRTNCFVDLARFHEPNLVETVWVLPRVQLGLHQFGNTPPVLSGDKTGNIDRRIEPKLDFLSSPPPLIRGYYRGLPKDQSGFVM